MPCRVGPRVGNEVGYEPNRAHTVRPCRDTTGRPVRHVAFGQLYYEPPDAGIPRNPTKPAEKKEVVHQYIRKREKKNQPPSRARES